MKDRNVYVTVGTETLLVQVSYHTKSKLCFKMQNIFVLQPLAHIGNTVI